MHLRRHGLPAGAVLLSLLTAGCAAAVGAGLGAGLLTTVALTAGCYEPVSVQVVDAVSGLPACDAIVTAQDRGGSVTRFSSCFYAEVPVGTWTVRAERPGYRPVTTELVVIKSERCDASTQTIELSLSPLDHPAAPPVPIRPPRPGEAPLAPGSLPAPGSLQPQDPASSPDPAAPVPLPSSSVPTEREPPLEAAPPVSPSPPLHIPPAPPAPSSSSAPGSAAGGAGASAAPSGGRSP